MKRLKFLFKWVGMLRRCEVRHLKRNFYINNIIIKLKLKCQDY